MSTRLRHVHMKREKGLTRETIKYLAVIAMTLDHAALVFLTPEKPLYWLCSGIGDFAAITMCFFLVEGYLHTRSFQRYACRLAIFGVLSQPLFYHAFSMRSLNIFFSLLVILLLMKVQDTQADPMRAGKIALLLCAGAFCDWSLLLAGAGLLLHRAYGSRKRIIRIFLLFALITGASDAAAAAQTVSPGWAAAGALAGILAVLCSMAVTQFCYQGRRAKHFRAFHKWFFYIYYPAHLAVLVLIRLVLLRET